MSDAELFATGIGMSLTVSVGVVWYLRAPLQRLLVELCGNQERAGFWTAFTAVAVGLTPLIFAIGWRPSAESSLPAIFELADQLKWALIGLLSTLLALGWLIGSSITRWEKRRSG
jgi:hypothetical protein